MDGGGKQPQPKLTAEAAGQFQSGIELIFSRWYTLQVAVENQWGGPHSHLRSQQMLIDIFNLFTQSKEKIYQDDVEELLEEAMSSLNVEFEDDDTDFQQIAEKLMHMHEECLEGNFSSIEMLRRTSNQRRAVPNVPQVVDDNSDDDSDDSEAALNGSSSDMAIDVSPPQSTSNGTQTMVNDTLLEPRVEAGDGFTMVTNKRNKGRKK